jgi:hypothetical protein
MSDTNHNADVDAAPLTIEERVALSPWIKVDSVEANLDVLDQLFDDVLARFAEGDREALQWTRPDIHALLIAMKHTLAEASREAAAAKAILNDRGEPNGPDFLAEALIEAAEQALARKRAAPNSSRSI